MNGADTQGLFLFLVFLDSEIRWQVSHILDLCHMVGPTEGIVFIGK